MAEVAAQQTTPHGQATRDPDGAVLARGALFNAIAFLASNLRGIFTFLVARLLGSAALGVFGLAWATTDLVSKLATCGLDTSAITFVARRQAAGDPAGDTRIMRVSLRVALGVSVLVTAIGVGVTTFIAMRASERTGLARATAVMMLALPGIVLYRVSNALSRGKGVMHHDIYSRGLTESLGTAAALLIALAFGARALAPEIAAIAGTCASGIVGFLLMRRLYVVPGDKSGAGRPLADDRSAVPRTRTLLSHSFPIALYGLLNIAVMQIDLIMLGLFVGHAKGVTLETLGVYAAACDVAGGLRKANQVFNPIFVPVVALQIGAGRIRDAEASYGYLARWMLALLLPALAVLVLAGGAIMRIYGPAFAIGGTWTAILGAACALNAFVGLGETILVVERPRLNLLNSAIACAAVILLNLLLIPAWGPLGAAIGMLVPYALQGALRGIEIKRIFEWRWPWRPLLKPAIAAGAALPLALIVRLTSTGVWIELVSSIVYLAGYAATWRIIGLDAHDRKLLHHFWRKDASPARSEQPA